RSAGARSATAALAGSAVIRPLRHPAARAGARRARTSGRETARVASAAHPREVGQLVAAAWLRRVVAKRLARPAGRDVDRALPRGRLALARIPPVLVALLADVLGQVADDRVHRPALHLEQELAPPRLAGRAPGELEVGEAEAVRGGEAAPRPLARLELLDQIASVLLELVVAVGAGRALGGGRQLALRGELGELVRERVEDVEVDAADPEVRAQALDLQAAQALGVLGAEPPRPLDPAHRLLRAGVVVEERPRPLAVHLVGDPAERADPAREALLDEPGERAVQCHRRDLLRLRIHRIP